jgi:hypothetical protein
MSNEGTKEQIRRWIENAIKEAKNPDPRKLLKKKREKKKKKVAQNYGLNRI